MAQILVDLFHLFTQNVGTVSLLTKTVVSAVIYTLAHVVYNLIFHPLAKFPGPILGSAFPVNLYSFFFDVVCDGKLYRQFPDLHDRYGPILRLGANELWFSDPSLHGDIYGRKARLMKDPRFYQTQALGLRHSLPFACELDDHRHLRSVFEKHWTRSAVLARESMIWDKIEVFCSRLANWSQDHREVCLHNAFRQVAIDIAAEFSWNKSLGELDSDTERTTTTKLLDSSGAFQIAYHFPAIRKIMDWDVTKFLDSAENKTWEKMIETDMRNLIDNEDSDSGINSTTLATRYKGLTADSRAEAAQKLKEEAITLIAGGSEGAALTLTVGLFYLLKDPRILSRLLGELKSVMPLLSSQPSFQEIKQLPYLAAVMKESLRLSYGATILPRIIPKGGAFIGSTFVPGGTTVQMNNYVVHRNKLLFPEPSKFIPERFLGENSQRLDKHLLNFSAGPAKCLGIELAQVEMYLIMAAIVRRFEISPKNDLSTFEEMPWVDHSLPALVEEKLNAYVNVRVD